MTLPAPEPLAPVDSPAPRQQQSRAYRFTIIAVLYLVTDIGFAFFAGALITILLDGGVAPETVGAITLIGLVYVLRFLIGPLVDRFGWRSFGHYRGWIVVTQILLLAALGWLATLDPIGSIGSLVPAMAVVLALSAFHDAAVNGVTVRLLTPDERGIGNGIQVGAATISTVIGAGLGLVVYDAIGWSATVLVLAGVFVIPLLAIIGFREPVAAVVPTRIPWGALGDFFRDPVRRGFVLVVVPALCVGPYLVTAILSALALDRGWDLPRIALWLGTVAPVLGTLGGLLAGAAISRWGRLRPLLAIGILYTVASVALLPFALGLGWDVVDVVGVVLLNIVFNSAGVWVYTIAMDNSRSEFAATDFSLQISAIGLLRIGLNSVGLMLIAVVGYPALVGGATVLTILGIAVALTWVRRASPSPRPPGA